MLNYILLLLNEDEAVWICVLHVKKNRQTIICENHFYVMYISVQATKPGVGIWY